MVIYINIVSKISATSLFQVSGEHLQDQWSSGTTSAVCSYTIFYFSRAKLAMDQCQKRLESLYPNKLLSLDVDGLGNFRNSVVFAKVRSEEQVNKLREIADIVEDCFLDHEIVSTEKSGSFKPHITVMKLTRDKSFRKKCKFV